MTKSPYSVLLPDLPSVNDALESCNPFISSAADLSSGAMDLSHPGSGFRTFISGGREDQSQPITASIGSTCELILVHQDEVKGQTQLIRMESVAETYPTWVSRRSPGQVVAHEVLVTPVSSLTSTLD
jgi:hypothetical protein